MLKLALNLSNLSQLIRPTALLAQIHHCHLHHLHHHRWPQPHIGHHPRSARRAAAAPNSPTVVEAIALTEALTMDEATELELEMEEAQTTAAAEASMVDEPTVTVDKLV